MPARRIAELTAKLHARTGPAGLAIKGYGKNVRMIRKELGRLANLQTRPPAPAAAHVESPEPAAVDKLASVVVPSPPDPTHTTAGVPIFRRSIKP